MGGNTFLGGPTRLSYPNVFKTGFYKGKDTGKYDATFLFPAYADLTPIVNHIFQLVSDKWPECVQGGQIFGVKLPLRDQGEKVRETAYTPGLKFIKGRSKNRPLIYDKPPLSAPVTEQGKVYSGVWCVPNLDIYIPKNSDERMVLVSLNAIQLLADDKPLGGSGPDPEKIRQQMAGVRVPTPIAAPQMGAPALLPPPGAYGAPAAPVYGQPSYGAPADPYAHMDAETRAMLGV